VSDLDDLVALIGAIEPVNEREASSICDTLARLALPGDPFSETASDHHITASAFVVSARGVILHRHRRLKKWVQPGGHVDPGEFPAQAALRETREETGLDAVHFDPPWLYQVDVHPGPRGHTHYDLRYVLSSAPVDPTPPAGESPDVFWFDLESARARCEPSLVDALAKLFADERVSARLSP